MRSNRREFLKIAGVSALTLLVPAVLPPVRAAGNPSAPVAAARQASSPLQPLTAGRWALAVDLSKCSADCTDCIAACHQAHNVPEIGNPKDEVKWIWREPFPAVFPDETHAWSGEALRRMRPLVLCNHCANPPCVRVCPTGATFQRPDGIVMMDYHRCIGCKICLAACPYGARSINFRDPRPFVPKLNPDYPTRTKGVIEKCNFCEERLARGLEPACVEACRRKALVFGDVEDPRSEIRLLLEKRVALRRRASLGTLPQVYYLL